MEEHNSSLGNRCCEEQHSSLGNPYDANTNLEHNSSSPQILQKTVDNENSVNEDHQHDDFPKTEEDMMDRAVENAVIRAIFNNNEMDRRKFMKMVGSSTAAAVIASIFPLSAAKAEEKISGAEVPKDTIVSPITRGETPMFRARADAPNTNLSAPQISPTNPRTMMTVSRNI